MATLSKACVVEAAALVLGLKARAHFRGDFRDILTCSRRPRSMALLSKMRLVEAAAQYGTMHEVRLVDAAAQHGSTLGNASLQGGREQGATLDHASRRGGRGVWR